jgi:tetratricopeptide (TPR) repeat protein
VKHRRINLPKQPGLALWKGQASRVQAWQAKALEHHRAGRLNDAEDLYRKILDINPRHADALHLLGVIAYQGRRYPEAVELIGRAIAIHPKGASYYSNLGNALQALGRLDEALETYRQSICLAPHCFEAHINLGHVLREKGALAEAVESYQHSLALHANSPEAYVGLGRALQEQGNSEEAERCYLRALKLNPLYALAHYNLGNFLRAQGDLEGALSRYRRALELDPNNDNAAFAIGLVEIQRGEFSRGWPQFERRWKTDFQDTPCRFYREPLWTGERLPSGNLFIWSEQGIGDEIMFAGLLPEVFESGNHCIVECDPRLRPLYARSFSGVDIVSRGAGETIEFAAHLPSGSLPGLYRRTPASFAVTSSPYLVADPAQRAKFRNRYTGGRRVVGLAWYTRNKKTGRLRSMDLSLFRPLFAHPEIRWVSLQYGDPSDLEKHAAAAGAPLLIDRQVDQLADMDLFAAQVAALDLVITIDNSTAHLAAALGVPVWLLLPFAPDWRWLLDRKDSPWYPTMRLFRQAQSHNWHSVIEQVRDVL